MAYWGLTRQPPVQVQQTRPMAYNVHTQRSETRNRVNRPRSDHPMIKPIFIAVCGFTLTACSGSMPSWDFIGFSSGPEQVRIESEPAGAEARSSEGPTCQTPCEFAMPRGSDFVVTIAMRGYQPVTVPVRPESPGGKLQPNPVQVELQPVAPVAPAKKTPAKKNPKPGAASQQ
jgi:hypothetical protein